MKITYKAHLLVAGMVAFLFASCSSDQPLDPSTSSMRKALSQETEYAVYKNESTALKYDQNKHQLYSGNKGLLSRIVADDLSGYIEFKFDSAPVKGKFVSGVTTIDGGFVQGITSGKKYEFYILDKKDDKCWVWCDKERFGALIWLKE